MSQQLARLHAWYRSRTPAIRTAVFVLALSAAGGIVGVAIGRGGGVFGERHGRWSDAEWRAMSAAVDRYTELKLGPEMAGHLLTMDLSGCPAEFKAAHADLVEAAIACEESRTPDGLPRTAVDRIGLAVRKCVNVATAR